MSLAGAVVYVTLSSMKDADVMVLGGGHNGLVAAGYLARAGLKTVVLEARERAGGGAYTEELWPGFYFSTCAHLLHAMPPKLFRDFHLEAHGVEVVAREAPILVRNDGTYYGPEDHDSERNRGFLDRWVPGQLGQKTAYETFKEVLVEQFAPYRLGIFPDRERFLKSLNPDSRKVIHQAMGQRLNELQEQLMPDRLVRERFAVEGRAIEADPGALSLAYGCMDAEYPGEGKPPHGFVRGGMGHISDALTRELEAAGGEIRTGCPVNEILIEKGRCVGVRLADGSEVRTDLIFSSLDPKQTFLGLISSEWLPEGLEKQLRELPTEVSCLKLLAVLSELPQWSVWDGDAERAHAGSMMLNATPEAVADSYADLEVGAPPRSPVMSFNLPSYRDPSLVREGYHTASVWIYPAGARLKGRTWDEARGEVLEGLINQITEHAPNFRDSLVNVALRTPQDIETENRMTDGSIWHVQHTKDTLFWSRPLPELSGYRSPIDGLFLCGSGQHPGGEVTGIPGHNAAQWFLANPGSGI